MRYVYLLAILMVAMLMIPVASAETYTVTVTVVGPDKNRVAGATVTLIDSAGNKYSNTTDSSGVTKISVPAGTYLVVVKAPSYYILSSVTVSASSSVTVDASSMHKAVISSVPISVDVSVNLTNVKIATSISTNATVYAPSTVGVVFPSEVAKFPFRYVFVNATYDSASTNKTSISLDMAKDYTVVAYYSQQFYIALPSWLIIVLIVVIILGIVVAFRAGTKTAKSMIEEYVVSSRRFVKKKVS